MVDAQVVERKLAVIFAADVAEYSRLMGLDEVGTLRMLQAYRAILDQLIAAHRGRIFNTAGDSVMADFASPVDAVECAVEVQEAIAKENANRAAGAQMRFRIGIHLGDVIVEGANLFGDGVNIAARLEALAEPGGICLSGAVRDQIGTRLRVAFTPLGEQRVKNIAEPVRAFKVGGTPLSVAKASRVRTRVLGAATAAVILIAAGGGGWLLWSGRHVGPQPSAVPLPTQPFSAPRLSMVVLPFANLGGDAEHEYFVDGVTESLTTDLSRIANAYVVARNTAFTYKGKPVDVKQIGRDLNVRYILEGSMQRSASRVRVNVQLIDATTGNHLWADRFDKPLADLFDMQDEIVSRLANQLRAELLDAEARRAETESNPDSVDLYFRGVATFNKGGLANIAQARELFDKAVELDPTNIDALVGSARVDAVYGAIYDGKERAERLASAEAKLVKGLSIAPRNYWAHLWLGFIQILTNRAVRGLGEMDRTLALNQNIGAAHGWKGMAKIVLGRAEEAEAHVAEAFRISSPTDGAAFLWNNIAGLAKLHLGADEEAAELFRRAIDGNRNYPLNHFYNAAALALLGRLGEAQSEVRAGLAIAPNYTIANYRDGIESDNPTYLAQRERVIEGMRKAGVPEEFR